MKNISKEEKSINLFIIVLLEIQPIKSISNYSKSLKKIFGHNSLESIQSKLKNPRVFDYINYETQLHKRK